MPIRTQIEWDVSPVLVDLGPFQIHWYGLLFMTGFVIGYFIMRWMFKKERKPLRDLDPLLY